MQACKTLVLAALSIALVAGTAEAKSLQKDTGPAEQPPASYTGKQYVDSRGCVYIRAGYAGLVDWVPRVTRGRDVVCGFKPTFAAKPAAQEAAPVKTVAKPKAAPVKTAPRTVAQTTPRTVAKPAQVAAAPVATAAPEPTLPSNAQALARAQRSGACNGAPIVSARYVDTGRIAVRCGAAPKPVQVAKPVPAAKPAPTPMRVTVTKPKAQPAPQPVRVAAVTVPPGYESVWRDDRLNPNRGKGTAAGQASMDLLWTQTVPRRLIDVTTGQDVTRRLSQLDYPYTDHAEQRADYGQKPVGTASGSLSTKAGAVNRYVQVARFGQTQNTKAAVAKLRALGLPVRVARQKSGGQELELLMAGPLTKAGASAALAKIRQAGFRDAYLR